MRNIILILTLIIPFQIFSQMDSLLSIQKINNELGGLIDSTLEGNGRFGFGIEVIGDVDHDGIDDIAVGAFLDDDGETVYVDKGAVFILLLNADGTVKSQTRISRNSGGPDDIINAHAYFGSSIAALGDLNGDGNVDIAVGMYGGGDDNTGGYYGAVYILFLDDDGTMMEYQKISNNEGGGPGTLAANDYFGRGVANIGDLNGDGIPDLAIHAYGDDDGATNRGAIFIGFLDYNGTLKDIQKISDTEGGFEETIGASENLGEATGIGDVNGDGIADIAIMSALNDDGGNNRGALWVCFMNADGTVDSTQEISDTQGSFTGTLDNEDEFGTTLGIGDIDGDGVPDLAVGARGDDDGVTNGGALWFLYLNNDGTVKNYDKIACDDSLLVDTVESNDNFITSLSSFGDRNNDGVLDLLIGAWSAYVPGYGNTTGEVYVAHFAGTPSYPNKKYHATTKYITDVEKHSAAESPLDTLLESGDIYGASITDIGDLDGDGINDVAVGAPSDDDGGTDRGAVYIQFLNADGSIKDYQKISDTEGSFSGVLGNSDRFGFSLCNLGDIDGDGVVDIAVGAYRDDDGGTDRGAVWILFLDSNGTVQSEQKISDTQGSFTGTLDNSDWFGWDVAAPGDIDDDGVADLAVAAIFDDDGASGQNRGAVWILFLDSNGTVQDHQKISDTEGDFNEGLTNSDNFGSAVCSLGDINQDGVPDIGIGAQFDDDGGLNTGSAYVIFLRDTGTVNSYTKLSPNGNGLDIPITDNKGFANHGLSGGYDFDLDGVNDLLLGAYKYNNPMTGGGVVWCVFLNDDGTVKSHYPIGPTSNLLTEQIENNDYLGYDIAVVDYNNTSNTAKIAIAAHADDDGATNAGAVYMTTLNMTSFIKKGISYVQLKNKLDGGYYYLKDKKLYFEYTEEYEIGSFRKLAYNIYDKDHTLVGGVDLSGNPLVTGSSLLTHSVGENSYLLDMSSLSLLVNDYYTMEVINDKNEKKVLRFKVYN